MMLKYDCIFGLPREVTLFRLLRFSLHQEYLIVPVADPVKQGGYVLERSGDCFAHHIQHPFLRCSCILLQFFLAGVNYFFQSHLPQFITFGLSLPFLLLNEVDLAL